MKADQNNYYLQYVNSFNDFSDVVVENTQQKIEHEEYEHVKSKIARFRDIKTVSEAKSLAKELFAVRNEINHIRAGSAQCTIINKSDMLKIILDSPSEMTCYSIGAKQEDK